MKAEFLCGVTGKGVFYMRRRAVKVSLAAYLAAYMAAGVAGPVAGSAQAQDADSNALLLADQTVTAVTPISDWRAYVEASCGVAVLPGSAPDQLSQRLSFDVQYDAMFSPGWRAVFSDRLDMNWSAGNDQNNQSNQNSINTIREAYLSWKTNPDTILDFGRINTRYGVGVGYNPTDYFRADSVRSVVSVVPDSLRENRQGSVMLRGQTLWDSGSLTALYSPQLSTQENTSAFNPDWGSTNNQQRWLLAVTQKIGPGITPQWLVYKEASSPVQLGFNLTGVLNDATVVYVEWSGGRGASLVQQAVSAAPESGDGVFSQRISSGFTYSTAGKLILTAEAEYNGAGLDNAGWAALRHGSPVIYAKYRNWLQGIQDLPTRSSVLFYGTWQDAFINHLDLSAMQRIDLIDGSRLNWLEARYHTARAEFALQWQRNSGSLLSDYGAALQAQSWQLLLRYYF